MSQFLCPQRRCNISRCRSGDREDILNLNTWRRADSSSSAGSASLHAPLSSPDHSPDEDQDKQKVPSNRSQTILTPELAIQGRIVYIRKFKKDSKVWQSGNVRKEAQEHPAVILLQGSIHHAAEEAVQVLPITSWNGLTKEEKWNQGKGIGFRDQYLLIDNGDDDGSQALQLRDGKRMRCRSYVSIREGTYILDYDDLVLYTDASRTDSEFLLTDESLAQLKKEWMKAALDRASSAA